MRKTINIIKQYWFFILLAALVAMLLAFWIIRRSQPKLPPGVIPSPTAGTLPQPQSLYSQRLGEGLYYTILLTETNFAQIPQALPVYRTKQFTRDEIISHFSKVIKELGFAGNPQEQQGPDGNYLIWQEEENYLQINIASGQLLFAGKKSLNKEETYNPTQIQNLVKQKLVSWKLISEETKVKEIKGFGVTGLELVPVKNLNQAIVFQLVYSANFEGYPLVGLGPAKNLIEVKVDNQGILNSLSFNLHQTEGKPIDNYPTKTYEETINELKEGYGQIIEILTENQEERSVPSLKEIQEIRISSVSLAYYVTTETQEYYQPVFLFEGKMILKGGENLSISLILPAIASAYLKPFQEHF